MPRDAIRDGLGLANWHAGWAVALGGAAIAWRVLGGDLATAAALAAAAAPGLMGQSLRVGGGDLGKALTLCAWPLGIGTAVALTGGLTGPLAPLALAPVAPLAMLRGRRLVAFGAALTAAMIAALALVSIAGYLPAPARAGSWLPLAALGATALGLAVALQMMRQRADAREAAEAAEARRLRAVLEASPQLLLQLGPDGTIREAFSASPDDWPADLTGRHFESLACDGDRGVVRAALGIVGRGGAAAVGFAPALEPDRYLAVDMRALDTGGMVAMVRDASRERAYEAYLEQAKLDAENVAMAKARFLANMSHELRTPLNAIIGFSDIMRSKMFGPLSDRYAEYAGLIHESGGHLLDLINDVLDMSKIEADRYVLNLEEFDAREAVSAALRLTRVQADTAKIVLRGALPSEPVEVFADRRAMKQITLNLISNALKFTPADGQVNVVARAKGKDFEIIVADTGVGIAPADLERLGRPYEQAGAPEQRAMGTGLGLSLVRAFAELHGGSMSLTSELGEGTVVTVRLPVVQTDTQRPEARAEAGGGRPSSRVTLGGNVIAFNPQR